MFNDIPAQLVKALDEVSIYAEQAHAVDWPKRYALVPATDAIR